MFVASSLLFACSLIAGDPSADEYFKIKIVDFETGRGVPLIELRTVNNIRHWTDSAGVAAFREPGLMDRDVYFYVAGHGYQFANDGFGFRGRRARTMPGGEVTWKIKRINIAERLYRVTGAGIYRDSVLLGDRPATSEPLINAAVLGSDSVVNTMYRGRAYWFWGDTNRARYPLGNFHVPGATSRLPADGGLDIERGVDLKYFVAPDGFAKETARMPGKGPTWINGLTVVADPKGERLFAKYVKVRGFLEIYERGLVEFNDDKEQFEKVTEFDMDSPINPGGHPLKYKEDGIEYIYFADPFPLLRVRATAEALADLDQYQAYTCLRQGTPAEQMQLDRRDDGSLRYAWKKNTPPASLALQQQLIAAGKARPEELLLHLQDAESGKPIKAHGGSVYWNPFRRRWVMIFLEAGGSSPLGEIWYAEGDSPLGPWAYARKIITHDNYSFYNPKQHPMFDKAGGRFIFLEGTYTTFFSGNKHPTPRYNYNQIMYKLDLADPRLALPVAIYDPSAKGTADRFGDVDSLKKLRRPSPPSFFALDRAVDGALPISIDKLNRLVTGKDQKRALFHALPADAVDPPATTTPLYAFKNEATARWAYSTSASWSRPGYKREAKPLCRVWRAPSRQPPRLSERAR